jgi:tetratricopeptide (TPR) repeat protein
MNRGVHKIYLLLFVISIVFPMTLLAQSDKSLVRKGNKDFSNGNYNEAEINYRKALDKNPVNSTAQFNLGDAMYQQENYEKAAEVFSASDISKKSSTEKSDIYYNLGNSKLKAGKADEAMAAYKQALRENPSNDDARYNLEYLRQKQQQNQDQNKDDKQDKDKQDQDKQNQDKQDQDKQDQDKQDQDKKEQNQDQQEQNKDQQQNQQDQKPEQGQQNEQQAQKISKKDAERMLEALKNNEKKTLENLKKAKKQNAKVIKSEKDW